MSKTVAIVGRPNVGKSTLFNRLVGKRLALVDPTPGVTRDRREGEARLGHLRFRIVDTAGLEDATGDSMEADMQGQTLRALKDADFALFLIDARAGVTPLDKTFAQLLRKSDTPVALIANKCEGRAGEAGLIEAWELGLDDPVPISAEHGEGMHHLIDLLEPVVGEEEEPEEEPWPDESPSDDEDAEEEDDPSKPVQIAIVGRPNAGKSTLVNRLLGEERVITGPEPGVTRDAISIEWTWRDRPYRLIDTAGLRRKARVTEKLEKLSAADTLRAIQYAHVVVLLLDAELGVERQDLTIARQVIDEGRAMVIAINKWDLAEDGQKVLRDLHDRMERSLPQVRGIPVVTLSALTGRGVDKLLPRIAEIYGTWNKRVQTGLLNRWLDDTVARHPAPLVQGRPNRVRYITQIKARPPTFALFVSRPTGLPESYIRYIANGIREDFEFPGVPLRIVPRRGRNPYIDDKK